MFLALMITATTVGCAPVPQSTGTWTGRVVPQTLQTNPRRDDVVMYQAAALHITSGPDIPPSSGHCWIFPPILVDEDGKILDPAAFEPSGEVHVEGVASRLWGANDPMGRPLFYNPLPREIDWVNGIIQVSYATDAKGHRIQLYLVKNPLNATTRPIAPR